MASRREGSQLLRALARPGPNLRPVTPRARRWASGQASAHLAELESNSSMATPGPDEATIQAWDPEARAKSREKQLPGSRYQFHPPKYDRGPLHPIQSPPSSDPQARNFVPGPFNSPRLRETLQDTIASDLMTLAYLHTPPGTPAAPERVRLRPWDDSSPYHKNRPLRGPRGGENLPLIEKRMTWKNIPEIKAIAVNCFVPKAVDNPEWLLVARNVVQAITGATPEVTRVKKGVVQWGTRNGDKTGAKAMIHGDAAYEFLDKVVNLVLPRIKDWPGISGSTGDSSGNLAFGLKPNEIQFFPELEVNFDMYPPKMMPGCHIFVQTTAKSDRHARLLLQALGFPFYGKVVD